MGLIAGVGPAEEAIFRRVNDASDAWYPTVWPVMQSGTLGAVFVCAGALRACGRREDALVALVSGTGVWAGVKVLKPLAGRGRPAAELDDVTTRGSDPTGLGFPSGHAAVATTLAVVATRRRPALRPVALATAAVTGIARIHVGAHLPLDVVGGWAIGLGVGRLADWLAGQR